jgi:hypothetical protein
LLKAAHIGQTIYKSFKSFCSLDVDKKVGVICRPLYCHKKAGELPTQGLLFAAMHRFKTVQYQTCSSIPR